MLDDDEFETNPPSTLLYYSFFQSFLPNDHGTDTMSQKPPYGHKMIPIACQQPVAARVERRTRIGILVRRLRFASYYQLLTEFTFEARFNNYASVTEAVSTSDGRSDPRTFPGICAAVDVTR